LLSSRCNEPSGSFTRRQPSPRAPLPRQWRWDHARNAKAPAANSPQVGDNLWRAAQPRIEPGREPALEWGSTSMEGTSGAAERVSLRGAAREAALAPVVVAKAASFPDGLASSSGRPVEHRELQTGPAGRPLTAGVWWASRKQVRPVGSSWAHASTCAPGGVGLSSRHRDELHDGRCPSRSGRGDASVASNRDGRRREGRKPAWPLTRETSAGSLRSSG
jgi:hypothetical protein